MRGEGRESEFHTNKDENRLICSENRFIILKKIKKNWVRNQRSAQTPRRPDHVVFLTRVISTPRGERGKKIEGVDVLLNQTEKR